MSAPRRALLQVGYVARAHGLRGELVIKTFDPESTAVQEVEQLVLLKDGTERTFQLDSLGEAPGGDLLVGLTGIDRREAADLLRGSTVHVFRDELQPPAPGEFFFGDLVGLEAFTPEGKRLGLIEEIWSTGPVPNLCIRDQGADELLVPFAEEFVPSVDLAAKRVTVIPPVFDE